MKDYFFDVRRTSVMTTEGTVDLPMFFYNISKNKGLSHHLILKPDEFLVHSHTIRQQLRKMDHWIIVIFITIFVKVILPCLKLKMAEWAYI